MEQPNIPYQKYFKLGAIIASAIFVIVFVFFPSYTVVTILGTYILAMVAMVYRMIYSYKHGYNAYVRKCRRHILFMTLLMILLIVISYWETGVSFTH